MFDLPANRAGCFTSPNRRVSLRSSSIRREAGADRGSPRATRYKAGIPCSLEIPVDVKNLMIKAVVYDMQGDRVGSKHTRVERFRRP